MPTTLNPIIYGKDKRIDFKKFNMGSLLKAIAFDLQEFGQRGVQGVKIAPNVERMMTYEKKANRTKDPYIQAGIAKGTLWIVLLDKKDAKFEAIDLCVKDYEKLKQDLAASSAALTSVSPHQDNIVDKSLSDTRHRLGTTAEDTTDFGKITGDIILTAHGQPAQLPSGRIIGDKLGCKTPQEIFELLTGSDDPNKRIGKDYTGKITLSGCFTASGGPEASKQDDPFAQKVLGILRKNGYAKATVVGYPGPTMTSTGKIKDKDGKTAKQGEELVAANQVTGDDYRRAQKLMAAHKQAVEIRDAVIERRKAARAEKQNSRVALKQAKASTSLPSKVFLETEEGKAAVQRIKDADAEFDLLKDKLDKARKMVADAKAEIQKSGLLDRFKSLEGSFGLREIN